MSSRKTRIETLLKSAFNPSHLEVIDESFMHHVPEGAESHFKVICVSTLFAEKTLVARHRWVNAELKAEFSLGLHALSLHLFTPEEWLISTISASPACRGGMHKEQHKQD